MIRTPEEWERRYVEDDLPWDADAASPTITETVQRLGLSGRVLEIGCGTGAMAVWLAARGNDVVAIDVSPTAVAMAQRRFAQEGVRIDARVHDILSGAPGAFDLVVDRGVFHCMAAEARAQWCEHVARALGPDGTWISVVGNADQVWEDRGPPRLTATELVTAVEPFFRVLELEATSFGDIRIGDPLAWRLVAVPR